MGEASAGAEHETLAAAVEVAHGSPGLETNLCRSLESTGLSPVAVVSWARAAAARGDRCHCTASYDAPDIPSVDVGVGSGNLNLGTQGLCRCAVWRVAPILMCMWVRVNPRETGHTVTHHTQIYTNNIQY